MKLILIRFVVVFALCCAAIVGAWLAGADPSGWTFAIAAWVSMFMAIGVTWWEPKQ